MKRLILALIILLTPILSLITITVSNETASAGTLAGWNYRKAITINHTDDGNVSNYQMMLTLNKSSGVDSTGLIYLENHTLNWPTDIYFTTSDGTTGADFWRESNTSTQGVWWVEADSILNGSTWTGYIYYGKVAAADASNGDNTFPFYDHFLVDISKWAGDTASGSIASSILTFTNTGADIKIYSAAQAGNVAMRTSAKLLYRGGSMIGLSISDASHFVLAFTWGSSPYNYVQTCSAATTTISTDDLGSGSYHIYDVCRVLTGTDTVRAYLDGVQLGSDTTSNVPTDDLRDLIRQAGAGSVYVDWTLLRNYTTNEPTWAASGVEERFISMYLTTSSGSGGNVSTPAEGTHAYNQSEVVTITAVADTCYHFVNWTGNTTDIGNVNAESTNISMGSSNKTATANFAINTSIITYVNGSNGGITGNLSQTVNCGTNGTAVTAVANTCYYFVNWSDASTANPRTDTNVQANVSVTANFAAIPYGSPTLITCDSDSNSIDLGWAKGSNTSVTYIRWKIGSYPTSITDGNLLPNQSGYNYTHTGLYSGTSYYYTFWGLNGSCSSTSNATVMCSTTAGTSSATTVPLPETDTSGWSNTPNGSALVANPLYGLGNQEAAAISVPQSTWWFLLGMGFLVVAGLFIYTRTENLFLAITAIIVFGSIMAWQLLIIPVWTIWIFGLASLGFSWKELR